MGAQQKYRERIPRTTDYERKNLLYIRDEGVCSICNEQLPQNLKSSVLTYDHLFPRSYRYNTFNIFETKDDTDLINSNYNLRLVHKPCNQRRWRYMTRETSDAAYKNILLLNADDDTDEFDYRILYRLLSFVIAVGRVNATITECDEKDAPSVKHAQEVYARLGITHDISNYAPNSWVYKNMQDALPKLYPPRSAYNYESMKAAYLSGSATAYAKLVGLTPQSVQRQILKYGFRSDPSLVPNKVLGGFPRKQLHPIAIENKID